jgi:hypothetical protein
MKTGEDDIIFAGQPAPDGVVFARHVSGGIVIQKNC